MDFEGVTKQNKNLDFVSDWVNNTVEDEIRRGKRLREEKPLPHNKEYEYNVANIKFLASYARNNQGRKRKVLQKSSKMKSPSTPKSKSGYARPSSVGCAYLQMNRILKTNSAQNKTRNTKKCSTRVAELAVPTKRQCIDTWRYKSNILPEFMVERLKEHVMDQRPIIKIQDALYCFQRQRSKSSNKCRQYKNKNKYEVLNPCQQMDTKTLCIVFALKVAKRLSKPLNFSFNTELENLSRIVSSDIARIISQCKCPFLKNQKYELIHSDVSKKVTVWITSILEDLSFKQLEEDLRDLEEEEGPVLDFIDDVVDNVMNICVPPPMFIGSECDTSDTSEKGVIEEESLTSIDSTANIFNKEETTQGLTEETHSFESTPENLTDTEHFRKEIYNIIDSINKESGEYISYSSGDEIENDDNGEFSHETEKEHDVDDENTDQIDNNSQNIDIIDNSEENNINVSEGFEILTEDDKNSKKVMFSITNLVNPDKTAESKARPEIHKNFELEDAHWNPQRDKSTIIFAEVNRYLLSDADETWPADLTETSIMKLSEIVSKSVTSLGRICEYDEKQVSPPNAADKIKIGDTKLYNVDKLNSMLPIERYDAASQSMQPVTKSTKETTTAELKIGVIQVDSKTLDEKDNGETTVPKISDKKLVVVVTSKQEEKHQMANDSKKESDRISTESQAGSTQDITAAQIYYSWKVHPKTAPSWVISWGKDRGEPSEDYTAIQTKRTKVTEREIRKWSKDLEKAFRNLDKWRHWISTTCKETVFLLNQKKSACPGFAKKGAVNWIRLKKYIYKDAILWTKLYQRTENNFKRLKTKYNNIEVVAAEYSGICTCDKTKTNKKMKSQ